MASQTQALAIVHPEPPTEDDYTALCAALEASARGRAFLAEYARRNRNADTERVLTAVARREAQMRAGAAGLQHMHAELRTLLAAIRLARPDVDAGQPPAKAAVLTELVDLLERRIDGLIEAKRAAPQPEPPRPPPAAAIAPPKLAEPELPAPSPLAAQPPAMTVVAPPPAKPLRTAIMPDVTVFDVPPAPVAKPPAAAEKPAAIKPPAARSEQAAADRLRILAPIMALSDDERLALFS